jgi:cob(I)alamin adenosyltransferase
MGYRLSKIYTRTGDDGTTGLGSGERTGKDDPRIEALGTVDELNAVLGLLACEQLPDDLAALVIRLQHELFDLGGELCMPGMALFPEHRVDDLENDLDRLNAELEPLKEFILPGGTRAAALAHLARTVCRRAERTVVHLARSEREERLRPVIARYLNRLSDLLFVLARTLNARANTPDVLWQKRLVAPTAKAE